MANVKSLEINGVDIIDIFYPVGTIYYTENNDFNPATQWGGTWEEIEGKFVLGCDSSDRVTSGLTGGEETHTLTTNEIPSHSHTFRTADKQNNTITGWTDSNQTLRTGSSYDLTKNTSSVGEVLLTTICLHIIQLIFGEELHKRIFLRSKIIRRNIYG